MQTITMPRVKKPSHEDEIRSILAEAGIPEESRDAMVADAMSVSSMEEFFGRNGLLARLFGKRIEDLMKAELAAHLGYTKNDAETRDKKQADNYRNGSFPKTLKTTLGDTTIAVPRDRNGEFEPKILPKGERRTNELETRIISMYGRGVTVSDIHEHLMETYGVDLSESEISMITDKIMPEINEWQNRLLDKLYVLIWLDCIHLPIRVDGKVEQRATYTALGLTKEGKKQLLGLWVSPGAESAKYWLSVLQELKDRGVEDVLIFCTDGLSGFSDSLRAAFPKCIHQKCVIHQIRNSLKYVLSRDQKEFVKDLKTVYGAATESAAKSNLDSLKEKWGKKYPAATRSWYDNWTELSAFFDFSPEIRKIMYTNNASESLNRQLRKITKNRSVFPTPESATKLLYLAGKNATKKWTMPIQNWAATLNQLTIHFDGRI